MPRLHLIQGEKGQPGRRSALDWGQVCWHCGTRPRYDGRYCRDCTLAGLNSDWINCKICGDAKRRPVPGQQSYTCRKCKTASQPENQPDQESLF